MAWQHTVGVSQMATKSSSRCDSGGRVRLTKGRQRGRQLTRDLGWLYVCVVWQQQRCPQKRALSSQPYLPYGSLEDFATRANSTNSFTLVEPRVLVTFNMDQLLVFGVFLFVPA